MNSSLLSVKTSGFLCVVWCISIKLCNSVFVLAYLPKQNWVRSGALSSLHLGRFLVRLECNHALDYTDVLAFQEGRW